MPEPTELLSLQRMPLSQAFERVHQGEITDSMAVCGLQKLELLLWRKAIAIPYA
jgi:hypothetical protein